MESHNRPLTDEEENWNLNMMVQAIPVIDRSSHIEEARDREGMDDI